LVVLKARAIKINLLPEVLFPYLETFKELL
jgi:hypothetical protein